MLGRKEYHNQCMNRLCGYKWLDFRDAFAIHRRCPGCGGFYWWHMGELDPKTGEVIDLPFGPMPDVNRLPN